jgi:cytochrome P450
MPSDPKTNAEPSPKPYYEYPHNQKLDHIAGTRSLPIIGDTINFLHDAESLEKKKWENHEHVYKVNLFFRNIVGLIGPDANQLVLLDRSNNFSSKMGWRDRLGILFNNGLMLRDFSDHRMHKQIMVKSFSPAAMKNYLKIMNRTVEESLKSWEDKPALPFYSSFKSLTLNIAATAFVGMKPGPEADRLNKAFIDTVSASISLIKLPIPGLTYKKGLEGRKFLVEYLSGMLPEKRSTLTDDMFSQFCHSKSQDGESFSDEDVINHMIFLLMAAHDTITSATTSLIYYLASTPVWQEAIREEGRQAGPGPINYEDLEKLAVLEACFNEALRLYPPVPLIPRRTVNDVEFKGTSIPAHTLVYINVFNTHRMEQYWSNPLQFDPGRFLDRKEHKQHPYLFVPFGGGAHMCIGKLFAYMEVKAFIHQFLQKFEVSLPAGYQLKQKIIPIPKPQDGLPIHLKKIK